MKRSGQVTAVVLAGLAVFVIREAMTYDYMTAIGPGGGFFPLWLGAILLVLSVALFVQVTATETRPLEPDFFPRRGGLLRIVTILIAIGFTAALLKPLGFRLTMLAFLVVLLRVLGRQHPLVTAAIAAIGSFGVAYVFTHWLRVALPVGAFGI